MTAHATTEKDGSAIVTLNGQPQKVIGASLEDARRKVASLVVDHAAATGEVVEFITTEPDGTWEMIVHPDGTIHEKPEPFASPYLRPSTETITAETPVHEDTAEWVPQAAGTRRAMRESFLKNTRIEEPAMKGWRGTATRLGLRLSPGPAEKAERDDTFAVARGL